MKRIRKKKKLRPGKSCDGTMTNARRVNHEIQYVVPGGGRARFLRPGTLRHGFLKNQTVP